jgi:hypothetical protein
MVQLQDSISECLHHHTLSNMLFDGTFEAYCAQILSCFSLGASTWLITQLIFSLLIVFPSFLCNISYATWTTPSLNCRHFSMCVHASHWPYGYPFLCCVHDNKHTRTHDAIHDTFANITRDVSFHVGCKQLRALLTQLKDLLLLMHFKPRKGIIVTNTPLINSSP